MAVLGQIMKETDDTDPPESESEAIKRVIAANAVYALEQLDKIKERIDQLIIRVANLETQRSPEMENDDPEWFS